MIASFLDKDTETVDKGEYSKRLDAIRQAAVRKLAMLAAATKLDDLKSPPGNCLEALKGDRKGQHSIRVNEQYRICFVWKDGNAHNVEIVDYH